MSIDRFARQVGLLPQERLAASAASVIGVGAIGRQVALQLAAVGVGRLQLVDFDTVEITNLASQGYREADLGLPKVAATAQAVGELNSKMAVNAVADRYRPRHDLASAVFCCVDSIAARAAIWRSACARVEFWADGRMLGEVIRVLAVGGEQGRDYYPSTLFAPSEAQTGRCTARSTIYAASLAAALMVHQFTRWLRGLPLDVDSSVNLLAGEWSSLA